MENKDLKKYKLPDAPGVYIFRGVRKKILYIGKATSLKSRVKSYFTGDIVKTRSRLISDMVDKAKSIDFIQTDSVLEALILEANLIKKHEPYYNSKEKDNKSFNYIVITHDDFPRILIVRGRELNKKFKNDDIKYLFGPFPQGGLLNEALKIIRKIFPFYDTKKSISDLKTKSQKARLVFNRQIGLYPPEGTTKAEYGKTIQNIRLFLGGKKKILLGKLVREMKTYASKQEFEKANEIKRKIFALEHIRDVSLIKDEFRAYDGQDRSIRIEAYDIAHLSGKNTVGVMVVIVDGEIEKTEYRKFKIKEDNIVNDTAHLQEIVSRRLSHPEWDMPKLIVIDGGRGQKNAVQKTLDSVGVSIPIVSVVKDEHHRPREILGDKEIIKKYEKGILLANSESHRFAISYHRKLRRK